MNRKIVTFIFLASLVSTMLVFAGPFSSGTLRVGATSVPHAEILNFIISDLAAQGIKLEVIEFSDYVTPNIALAEKQPSMWNLLVSIRRSTRKFQIFHPVR